LFGKGTYLVMLNEAQIIEASVKLDHVLNEDGFLENVIRKFSKGRELVIGKELPIKFIYAKNVTSDLQRHKHIASDQIH
jgi:hypothetical protein